MKLYPLTFDPIFKQRIWGGRNLETLYGKPLPPALPIGESWEISDRPGDESLIARGPLRGKTLHWLLRQSPAELLGPRLPIPPRFPLLIKILDAQATLSLQVHPPGLGRRLIGRRTQDRDVVCRPRRTRRRTLRRFEPRRHPRRFRAQRIAAQTVAECFHRIPVKRADAMFLPSGRLHALGAETVIFEIQQNSDTTYRVFDWNRLDRDGKARQLHLPQSLASIDFADFEPSLLPDAFLPPIRAGFVRWSRMEPSKSTSGNWAPEINWRVPPMPSCKSSACSKASCGSPAPESPWICPPANSASSPRNARTAHS